ncbi:Annexin C1 [Frankliniella fusca]|uniref:Annexin C1 n=1 Tax=Frankliniella fusca TaxID=407009 RepID=A0AAE1HFH9_9NEOP|nr:Annexin C1 [Frankliniella fusca]
MRALVVWTKENKIGIEPISNVPANARFAGAVTPVRFSGDKKWYPGKVVMLSDCNTALEEKCKEMAEQLLKEKDVSKPKREGKRKRKSVTGDGKASEQDVARALGSKVPLVRHLQEAKGSTEKAKKTAEVQRRTGQDKTDRSILELPRYGYMYALLSVILFDFHFSENNHSQKPKAGAKEPEEDFENNEDSTDDEPDDANDSNDDLKDGGEAEEDETSTEKWCQCNVCQVLQKYDDSLYLNFLSDMTKLYAAKSSKCRRFLVLQAILPRCKQSELVPGSGIYIKSSAKDEIRVDFKNKPSSLVRETLYALYGKEQFKVLQVTARGIKRGSYGIQEDVLKALVEFVNKNCEAKKALTLKSLVIIINKRAPEWRRGEQSSRSPRKKKNRVTSPISLKVTSTSPFKCTPLKSPRASLQQSPRLSPRPSPVISASKLGPQEGIALTSPKPKRRLFDGLEPAAGKPVATPAPPGPPAAQHSASPAAQHTASPAPLADQSAAPPQWPGWNYTSPPLSHPSPAYGAYGQSCGPGYGQSYGASSHPPRYNYYDQHYQYSGMTEL